MAETAHHWHLPLGVVDRPDPQDRRKPVRRLLGETADAGGMDRRRTEDLLLVTGELLANAYAHTPGPTAIDVDLLPGRIVVAVTDSSDRPPAVLPYRPARPRGHGMHIVDRLAVRWGVTPAPDGKTVWAVLVVAP
ncbi:ATP-binding protein [Kitasatospora cinereorecta]|uniref:ATP-binding protein n=1 Tax=Kitasatospora cinereorecta TaxID=285560 RepID=A0ABW0VC69_9ACTN